MLLMCFFHSVLIKEKNVDHPVLADETNHTCVTHFHITGPRLWFLFLVRLVHRALHL